MKENHYYPFGLTLTERTFIIGKINDIKFRSKELDSDIGLNWYDFGARRYDMQLGRWTGMDPLADKYYKYSPYNYTLNNPISLTDPTGMDPELPDLEVEKQKNGNYKVTGGIANNDKNIYVVENGKRSGVIIGKMLTEYSFHDENGDAVRGAMINPNDKSGINFLNKSIINNSNGLTLGNYMKNATGGKPYDFKARGNIPKEMSSVQHHYRGMLFSHVDGFIASEVNGIFASARDFGNIAAGYVARRHGIPWVAARKAFDALESYQNGEFTTEGQPTQRAELIGHDAGFKAYENAVHQLQWENAKRIIPIGPK